MGSTYQRSFVKGICWEIISFLLTFALIYLFYSSIITSLKTAFIITLVKIPFYFCHERIWKRISWGKIPTNLYEKHMKRENNSKTPTKTL